MHNLASIEALRVTKVRNYSEFHGQKRTSKIDPIILMNNLLFVCDSLFRSALDP